LHAGLPRKSRFAVICGLTQSEVPKNQLTVGNGRLDITSCALMGSKNLEIENRNAKRSMSNLWSRVPSHFATSLQQEDEFTD
jgi:hypothetical protein